MLTMAKRFDCSNPLNRIFVDQFSPHDVYDDDGYLALTRLYLSVFYPQDVDQARKLCIAHKGKEGELYKNLASNFRAINPLKMKKKKADDGPIDYEGVLTAFFRQHDKDRSSDAASVLCKCKGKESILFSVLALKYNSQNALNAVFENKLKGAECNDHPALLKLYLQVFHPSCTPDVKTMLSKYQGKEGDLYAKLSLKFRACNPLDSYAKLGKTMLESLVEDTESEEAEEDDDKETRGHITGPKKVRRATLIKPKGGTRSDFVSPKRGTRARSMPQSPAVTP